MENPVRLPVPGGSEAKVGVVMPAYNAAKTLHMRFAELPHDLVDLVIGRNQKTCCREALRSGADTNFTMHLEYQYDPPLLPQVIAPIKQGNSDVVLGSRLLNGDPMSGGMPFWTHRGGNFTQMQFISLQRRYSRAAAAL